MGHSSVRIPFDTYGHLFPQAREEAAKKLQKAMFVYMINTAMSVYIRAAAVETLSSR